MDAHTPKRKADDAEKHANGDAKKVKLATETNIIFAMASSVGALQNALQVFKDNGVDLTHIESRPVNGGAFEFFVATLTTGQPLDNAISQLRTVAQAVHVIDSNPETSNPMWFPRKIRDLDLFSSRVLDAGTELQSDHPGFTDPVYRSRRQYFADIALTYKHGTPIPHVEYTQQEIDTWGVVFTELTKLYPTHACEEHNRVFPLLVENCGYRVDNIPQLEDISNFLHGCTGFRLRPVAGLLSSRDFLAGLAFRVFHSTQYIRHSSRPMYTPEPDICHEILGHVPLFADKDFAEFSQEVGLASLGASDADIEKLATCYWFTIEYGLCRQRGQLRAYGAGLLSSFGELQYCLTDKPKLQEFDPAVTGATKYPITEYQPLYFVSDSFVTAKSKMRTFSHSFKKPFQVHYNPYTETVDLLETAQEIKELALHIRADMHTLCDALARKAGDA